jgi:hypothetical protein
MMKLMTIVALIALAVSAHAQQPPTPSQLANGVAAAVIQMAQTIERQDAEIAELKKQLAGKDTPPAVQGMPHAPLGMSHALPHPSADK